jgi:hypothetical protein
VKRRSFLSAVVAGSAGLSGCTGLLGGGGTDRGQYEVPERSSTPTETPTNRDDTSDRFSRVVELDHAPRTIAATGFHRVGRPGIEIRTGFTRTGTADHPPTFAVEVSNARDVPAVVSLLEIPGIPQWMADREPPTGAPSGRRVTGPTGDRPTLALVPVDRNDLAAVRPELIREGPYWRVTDAFDPGVDDEVRIEPGEAVLAEFAVVGGPRTVDRPPGTYRFDSYRNGIAFAVWNTERPGPDPDSRFAGEAVPSPGERSVRWFHEADPTTPVYVQPSTERTDLPGLVEFHLFNRTTEDPGCGGWSLYKRHEGEWFPIQSSSEYLDAVCRLVPPGTTVEWSLRAYHGDPVPSEDEGLAIGHLGGGRYAVVAGYGAEADASGALFDVEADPVAVTADEDVVVEADGSNVVVADGDLAPHEDPVATITLTRSGGDPEETYIAEQLLQPHHRALRNALAFFEAGVESVRFRAAERPAVLRSSFETTPDRIAFDGRTYEFSFETDP